MKFTEAEVAKLEAGRELDALVAEYVMGWTRHPEPTHPTDNRTIGGVLYCPPGFPYDMNSANVVPCFSTDIPAMWQVIEHFNEFNVQLYSHEDGWTFEIYKNASMYEASAGMAPGAVCKSALLCEAKL